MSQPLQLLIIEDTQSDAALVVRQLHKAGYDVHDERVENAAEMRAALARQVWEVVIADYRLPEFDAPAALALLQQTGLDIPFIVVSGAIGEDTAVAMMRAGAHDYLMKDKLSRLAPAVDRELREARIRRERKQAAEDLRQRAAQLALINDIGSKVAALSALDAVLERAARLVQESFGYHHVALFLLEGEAARLKAVAGSYRAYFPPQHSQPLDQGIIGWVGRHGQKMVVGDVSGEPRYMSNISTQTVTRAELCLPIKIANRVVGLLDIQSPQLNAFSDNDVLAMETLTHQIAVAIENARLYEAAQQELAERKQAEAETRQRNRELTLLNEVIAASAAGLEAERVLEIACHELASVFALPYATAALFDEEQADAQVVVDYSAPGAAQARPNLRSTTFPVAVNPIFQYLLNHKKPLIITDAAVEPRLAHFRELVKQRGIVSLLVLPLTIGGKVIGSLGLEAVQPRYFSPEEINLAWSVADQVAGALARARLTQLHHRLSAAIEQAGESIIITDIDGTIQYVNPTFERVSGYSRAEAVGQNPRLLKSGQQDAAFYAELWATISAGQVWHGRFVNKRKDGTLYTEEATIAPVRSENGAVINYVAVKRDVTSNLELEERYRQAQKMEAIGQLSGGVAHDFNNLLVVISGYSNLLLDRYLDPADPLRQYVEEIRKAGERAARLTQQLLAFSRRQVLQPTILNLNEEVAETEKMLRRLIGENIELATHLAGGLGQIKADPGQIEQVIMNMAVNARDAMPNGGKLTIDTANVTLDDAYAREHPGVKPGRYVMLAISDTGIGMDKSTLAHIFEPFFTTKAPGKGTGLGLATAYGIVKQSGGDIWVYSEAGYGTVFKVYLPRVDDAAATPQTPSSPFDLPGGSETILLVEDEEAVRSLVSEILGVSGYTVLEASHGGEALLLDEAQLAAIDLLITDVIMPGGLNGRELAERLKSVCPGLKVLYISGYTNDAIVHHGVLETGVHFLQKPFSPDALTEKVRQVLDRS